MKFYKFDGAEFEYMAIVWAQDEEEAEDKYEDDVCSIGYVDGEPSVIDVDEVFQLMIDNGFDGDKDRMAIGQIGELYKIITSKEPIVVLHNCQ